MSCDEQRKLRDEEIRAWTAYKKLEKSRDKDTDELRRRGDNANLASSRLHQHISRCPECRPKGIDASQGGRLFQ
jgi:hypothetical protein